MSLDFERALKYPFEDKKWVEKLLPLFLIMFIILVAVSITQIFGNGVISAVFKDTGIEDGFALSYITSFTTTMGVSVLLFPLSLYLSGYMLKISQNVMKGEDILLPPHSEYEDIFAKGLVQWLARFTTGIIPAVILTVYIILASTLFVEGAYDNLEILLLLIGIALYILMQTVASFISIGMLINYMRVNHWRAIFDFDEIKSILQNRWKDIVLFWLVMTALSAVASLLIFMTCCLAPFTGAILQTLYMLIYAYIMGNLAKLVTTKA